MFFKVHLMALYDLSISNIKPYGVCVCQELAVKPWMEESIGYEIGWELDQLKASWDPKDIPPYFKICAPQVSPLDCG